MTRHDDGFAMVTAVIVSALIVAVTGALVLSLTSGGRESARQRELYEARAAGVSALEYLYAVLGMDPDFFDGMLKGEDPETYDWIDLSSAVAPVTGTDGDWNQFGSDLAISACSTRLDPCWTMRFAGDGLPKPQAVAVEAIVRFDCRSGGYCSVRRFQQQLRRTNDSGHAWQRTDLSEVTAGAAIPTVTLTAPPSQITGLRTSSTSPTSATVTWNAPTGGGPATSYHIQWMSGTQRYPNDETDPRHQEVTSTSYAFSGLTHSTTYTVRVRGIGRAGRGTWSYNFDFATQTLAPNAPSGLRWSGSVRIGGNYAVTLEWSAPSGVQAVDSYLLQWKSGTQDFQTSGDRTSETTSTSVVVLIADGSYRFRVLAKNSHGFGRPSSEVPLTVGVR